MEPVEDNLRTRSLLSNIMVSFAAIIMDVLTTFIYGKTFSKDERSGEMKTKKQEQRYVLVTGCDCGFGYNTAKRLDELGFNVLAGCLNVNSEKVQNLKAQVSSRFRAFQLDVTNEQDLKNVEEWIRAEVPEKSLWGLVNNAGVCLIGTPEIMSAEDIKKIFDVNLLGTVNVTKTFLPFVRKAHGRLINMGSMNGDVPMPFFSIYCASKAAVKMFTESLSHELKIWGVKSSLIAPAGYKTGILGYDRTQYGNKWWAAANKEVRDDYGKDYFNMPLKVSGRIRVSEDCGPVVAAVVDALMSDSPKEIYRPGQGGVILPTLMKFVPSFVRSYLCGSMLNFVAGRPQSLPKDEFSK